jgi:transposase-like protein/uncharacterized protein YbaR (Trm112 family)
MVAMFSIITHLLVYIQYLEQNISMLLQLLCRYMPLRQMAYEDSRSPDHQKFKLDKLPVIIKFEKQDYQFLLEYYLWKYKKPCKPIQRRGECKVPEDTACPRCDAPHLFIYDNNGGRGEFKCKVCGQCFVSGISATAPLILACPYCGKTLQPKRQRKHFTVHTCRYSQCSYYLASLKKLPKDLPADQRSAYKLHYVYREFHINFFAMDLHSLPDNASSLKFTQKSAHIMGLCLTYHVNLSLSLRKTSQALKDIHNVSVSHTMVANYAHAAAAVIKPFVVNYPYERSETLIGDETYIKVRGVRAFVWFVMDAASRSIIGFRVSATRAVGDCILAMRMAFGNMSELPEDFRFIADGYSAYPLAAQQFELREDNPLKFDITAVIGLTNLDAVSEMFRPYKQIVERLNRTFKASYRVSCGYDNYDGADYAVSLWVAYYNFLRPHRINNGRVLNRVDALIAADNMPAKWQVLISLGQLAIINIEKTP